MEYASKGTLFGFLRNARENKFDFKWENRYQIALDIAKGLNYIHIKGILHRDIKSISVLLDESLKAIISDFEYYVMRTQSQISSGVEYLAKSGSNRETRNNDDCNPLHHASLNGHVSLVEYLVKSGSNHESSLSNCLQQIYLKMH